MNQAKKGSAEIQFLKLKIMMVQNNQNLCFTKSKKELLNFLNRPDFFFRK